MKQPSIQIEPTNLSRDDFGFSKTRVEPTVQDKFKVLIFRVSNNPVRYLQLQPVFPPAGGPFCSTLSALIFVTNFGQRM
jgi:hypothetical protein